MSSAAQPIPTVLAAGERRGLTVAERNFWLGAALTLLLVLVFQGVFYVEREILHRSGEQRLVGNSSEAAMRYFTIPHIVIGFLFSVSAQRNRTPRRRALIGGLLLLGAALCYVYYRLDGYRDPAVAILVYSYFLVHEMRDESFFYTLLGGGPPIADRARFARLSYGLMAVVLGGLAVLVWPAIAYGLVPRAQALSLMSAPAALRETAALAPFAIWVTGSYLFLQRFAAVEGEGRIDLLLRRHAPLFRLFCGVVLMLGVAMVIAQRPYAIILLHVSVWYVFTCRMLAARPPSQPPADWWGWMRTTVAGFRVLHVGMALALIGLGVFWMYAIGGGTWLRYFLSAESFLYWTIMHITVSFVPRP